MANLPEFHVMMKRPAHQDCYRVNVVTGKDEIIKQPECDKRVRKVIMLERADFEIVKKALYTPCIRNQCDQPLDLISGAFESLDKAVGKIPLTK